MPATTTIPHLFRIAPGPVVHASNGLLDSQRFVFEVDYLTHFAGKIGECLGMKKIELGLVEDARSQTAFCFATSPDGHGRVVNGVFAEGHRAPSELVHELHEE